jgi:hypothetical protein
MSQKLRPQLIEVIATDASFVVCFVQSVASTARSEELSLNAAVESTDRSLSHSTVSKLCSPIDGAKARRWLCAVGGVRDTGVSVMSQKLRLAK